MKQSRTMATQPEKKLQFSSKQRQHSIRDYPPLMEIQQTDMWWNILARLCLVNARTANNTHFISFVFVFFLKFLWQRFHWFLAGNTHPDLLFDMRFLSEGLFVLQHIGYVHCCAVEAPNCCHYVRYERVYISNYTDIVYANRYGRSN